ncbi:Nn.00g106500.m01.CDS01 [Neocucurbitaria sp. VM-36]
MVYQPETYFLKPNEYAPNNELPVLVYRDCLPLPLSEEKTKTFLESHAWVRKGTWGHIDVRHFHPNTHECYGIFQGSSTLLLGCGISDTSGGQEVEVQAGDVIVLPAGTAHCNLQSTKEFTYVGVYPEGAPHYRNELGKNEIDHDALRNEINSVAKPSQDPVNGVSGPLIELWSTS